MLHPFILSSLFTFLHYHDRHHDTLLGTHHTSLISLFNATRIDIRKNLLLEFRKPGCKTHEFKKICELDIFHTYSMPHDTVRLGINFSL